MPLHELADAVANPIRTGLQRNAGEIALDLRCRRGSRTVAALRFHCERAAHDMLQVAVDVRGRLADPVGIRLACNLRRPGAAPGARRIREFVYFSTKQLVQNEAKPVDIAGGRHRAAGELFRAGVVSGEGSYFSDALARRVRGGQLGDAEIEQDRRVVAAHEYIRRLQVAVHDQVLMGLMHCLAELLKKAQAQRQCRLALHQPARQHDAFDVLHDQVRLPLRRGAAVEQSCNVRMHQARQNLTLAAQPLERASAGESADQLDRDPRFVFAVRTLGQIDAAHAAAAEFVEDAIVAHASPDPRRRGVHVLPCCGGDACRQRIIGRRVAGEQRLDLITQRLVAGACAREKVVAQLRCQRHRGIEQFAQTGQAGHG